MSEWSWDDLVNMRAYGPEAETRRAEEEARRQRVIQEASEPLNPADTFTALFDLSEEFFSNIMRDPANIAATGWQRGNRWRDTQMEYFEPLLGAIENPEIQEFMRGIAGHFATGLSLPALVMEPGPAEFGVMGRAAMDALPVAASLFPASKMASSAPLGSGWGRALREIFSNKIGSEATEGLFEARDFTRLVTEYIPDAQRIDDAYFRIPSRTGSIEVVEHGGNIGRTGGDALEVYVNGDIDPDDLARFIDLADAGDFELITEGGSIPYDLARRLGFVEESLGGRLVRAPVPDEPAAWYVEMVERAGGDPGGELWRASGLQEGDMVDELNVMVLRKPGGDPVSHEYWITRIHEEANDPDLLPKLINDMTEEGIIPRIPDEDFVPRLPDPPEPGDFTPGGPGVGGELVPGGGRRGFDPGDYDPDQLSDWASKIKKAQEDAIRRGSPYTIGEWARFLDVENVRMPDGSSLYDEAGHLKPAARDIIARIHEQMNNLSDSFVELTDAQVAGIVSSEFGLPVTQDAIRDADRVLYGLQDSMALQENAISLLRSTDVELTPKIAGNVIESFFAIRPEDIGRTGDELIEWMDSVQRAYRSLGRWSPGAPRYNVNEVLNRGLADLKVVASRPMASGGHVSDYDLLAAVRRMGSDTDGLPRNLWDVVDDLHQIYPTVPLEQLESIAEMALL